MKTFREMCVGFVLSIVIVFWLVNSRWIAIPFLVIAIWVTLKVGSERFSLLPWIAWAVLLVSFFSPIDVDPFGSHMHGGNPANGIRLVRLVYGMPRDSLLVEKYGEYYSGGCRTPPFPPQWILTWN